MTDLSHSVADHDTSALVQRVRRRRERYARTAQRAASLPEIITRYTRYLVTERRALPMRYAMHLLVGLLVPLAMLATQAQLGSPASVTPAIDIPASDGTSDIVAPVAPLDLDMSGDTPVPDSAFDSIDALPMPGLNPQLLRPQRP